MSDEIRHPLDELETDGEIERGETGVRILLTLLFTVVAAALEAVISVIVVFELAWALVTRRRPDPRVRDLANRVVAYYYRIGRYLTYNDDAPPFPFADFPEAVEPPGGAALREPS
ncbi:MAG: DUF4389 domain-containing protein [Myxococcota bacterium]